MVFGVLCGIGRERPGSGNRGGFHLPVVDGWAFHADRHLLGIPYFPRGPG